MVRIKSAPQYILSCLISCYQYFISSFLAPRCRFYPSCSVYMKTAMQKFGLVRGLYLGLKRLGKCHPFHPGGIDFLPEPKQAQAQEKKCNRIHRYQKSFKPKR